MLTRREPEPSERYTSSPNGRMPLPAALTPVRFWRFFGALQELADRLSTPITIDRFRQFSCFSGIHGIPSCTTLLVPLCYPDSTRSEGRGAQSPYRFSNRNKSFERGELMYDHRAPITCQGAIARADDLCTLKRVQFGSREKPWKPRPTAVGSCSL